MFDSTLSILFAYLCGSIPTAVWYGKLIHNVDIRNFGSGNAGATNSLRVLGKKAGVIVLLIDFLKGFIPVMIAKQLNVSEEVVLLTGFAAIIGHLLPIFAQFRGGKGVATSLGVVMALNPYAGLLSMLFFILTVALTKYVSLGALVGAAVFPVYTYFFTDYTNNELLFSVAVFVLLAFTHRKNIERLLQGNESKIGSKSPEKATK